MLSFRLLHSPAPTLFSGFRKCARKVLGRLVKGGGGGRQHVVVPPYSYLSIRGLSTSSGNPPVPLSSTTLRDKKIVPDSDPPSSKDVNLLYQFIDNSTRLMVLTGAGISTECGIPDYRSPNGAYSTGFRPITHQEFLRSLRTRRRYWARSYAGWRRFTVAQPGAAHYALASMEKVGRLNFMVTQNVDRLHHRAGSNPLELHGTVYSVICLDCSFSFSRNLFQDQLKVLNPKGRRDDLHKVSWRKERQVAEHMKGLKDGDRLQERSREGIPNSKCHSRLTLDAYNSILNYIR